MGLENLVSVGCVSRITADMLAAILKAVAEKLIPGIPIQTRISILQQTSADPSADGKEKPTEAKSEGKLSVLEAVIDRATSRNEIQQEIDGKDSATYLCFH